MSRLGHLRKRYVLCKACKRNMTRDFGSAECASCRVLRMKPSPYTYRRHVEPGIVSKRRN